ISVTAVTTTDKPSIYSKVDDDATIVLRYAHAQAVLQASWNWPFSRKDMEIYGATGYAITVASDQTRVRLKDEEREQLNASPALPSPHDNSLSYLAAVLAGKIDSANDQSSLGTNIIVMQILDAARESAHTGRSVHLRTAPPARSKSTNSGN